MSFCTQEAKKYASNGYSVIPIGQNKRPKIKWSKYQKEIATNAEIDKMFNNNDKVGIVTGEVSHITVIDIDIKNDTSTPLEAFPETYTVKTPSGGYHLYYWHTDKVQTSANQYSQFPHVDIRNDGGYIVAPPTKGYEIVNDIPLASFPDELFPQQKKKPKTLDSYAGVESGNRNDTMASLIGKLLRNTEQDKWNSEVWPLVVSINKTYSPPLKDDELKSTFESIAKKELSNNDVSVLSPVQMEPEERIVLRTNKNNQPHKDMVNVMLVLQQHPLFSETIKYNTFRNAVEFNGEMLTEKDLLHIQSIIQDRLLPGVSKQIVDDAVQQYAHTHSYDEAIEWLKTLEWDGVERVATWLPDVADLEHTDYTRSIGAQWFMGMVKRLVNPGCVFDHVLVLVGGQGIGKTSLFRILGGDWYRAYNGGLETKDFYLLLSGAMIVDLDEGATMYKSESIKLKSMITQIVDEYRAPYARRMERHKRRFVFGMTTNDMEPFRDYTGNRRYLPVTLPSNKQIDFKWLEKNRDQLFAEAYDILNKGRKVEQIPIEKALEIQNDYLPQDEWEPLIIEHLKTVPGYCSGDSKLEVTIPDLYLKALKGNIERIDRKIQMRMGNILRNLGFERVRKQQENNRVYVYKLTEERQQEIQKNPYEVTETESIDDLDW